MKRLLLLIITVTLATFLIADPVPETTILQVAENWLEMYTGTACTIDNYQVIKNGSSEAILYRIDFNPDGYVLIAADNSSLPILAYSDTGSILDTANPAREDLICQYSNQISEIKANNLANTYTLPIWSAISSKDATSLESHLIDLGADWDQNAPYNNYCPYDDVNLGRSVVGCTATATSQIINYHKYWDHTLSAADGYTSIYHGFTTNIDGSSADDDFPNFNTLNNYMNAVVNKFNNNSPLNSNDKAALCFAAGIMDRTNYSSLASGATSYDAQVAYINLNYNSQLLSRSSYSSAADWQNLILEDLNADRPVQYVGRTAPTGGSGHVFILHGYRTVSGVTQFKINWGWGAGYNSGYYLLTELNVNGTSNSYNYHHQMYHGLRPKINLNQAVILGGGTGALSQILVDAHRAGGSTTTYSADYSGVFNIDLAEAGNYQFTFYHTSGAYIPHITGWIPMHKGSNSIQSTPIVLESRPTLVHVPAQAATIQEGIDLVADGGAVIVASGTYSVNELSWANKHVRLIGSNNPVLTSGSHAIKLDWSGINNTDRIHGFTFQHCYGYDNGPAIMLLEGASPLVSNCTFDANRVQGEYIMEFNNPSGYGGAVFIQGGSNQLNSPRFESCTFTNNAAANGNGGGAVALFGPASFLSCTFTDNWTETAVGFDPPSAYFAAGAILIYGNDYNGEILIHNCTFTGNSGQYRANDIWVAGSRGINKLTIDNCTFNPDTSYSSEPLICLFYDNMPYYEASTTDFVLTMNKFYLLGKGAVDFHDYAGRCSMQFNNNIVNGLEGLTYGLKLHYYGGAPQNPDYFQFNNNTLLNLTSSGLVLFKGSDYTIENNIFHN
ncbi:MAG: C10 family peptidase, partial [Candidatus Cloacimonetes bacterium]|nr:C10 family peptidase [Candidatus Cloacimonadota bacterium]